MQIDRQQFQQTVKDVVKQTLLPLLNNVSRQYKQDGSIVTFADKAIQQALTDNLQALWPEVALLGEEMPVAEQQVLLESKQPLWCLDPIDGTSNFAADLPFFSISIGLIEDSEVTLAMVYDPSRDESFTAVKGQGAWLNDMPLKTLDAGLNLRRSIAYIDFKRLPAELSQKLIQARPYGSQRNLGSTALELCWLAAGRGHIYLHGEQHIWDYAAAELILNEAGGYSCTLEGDSMFSNALEKRSGCAAVDQSLFNDWKNFLGVAN